MLTFVTLWTHSWGGGVSQGDLVRGWKEFFGQPRWQHNLGCYSAHNSKCHICRVIYLTFAATTKKYQYFFFSFFQPPADYKTKTGGIVVFLSVTLIFNGPQGFHCLTTQCSNSNMTVAQIGGSKTTIITLLANKGCHFFNPHPFCVCCLFGDLFDILSRNLCKNTDETINTTLMLKF